MAASTRGSIVQISVNPLGGVPKYAVEQAELHTGGVVGDKQRYRKIHGGPDRAVCIYSWELIRELQEEGHPIDCGTTGENLTISGIPWQSVVPGARLRAGDALLEIVSYTSPCQNIAASFTDGEFTRISHKLHPGWSRVYARVVNQGAVRGGDEVVIEQPHRANLFEN